MFNSFYSCVDESRCKYNNSKGKQRILGAEGQELRISYKRQGDRLHGVYMILQI